MPRCKDCTHYQSKSFPEMPWNYECKIGHDMPEYGDTNSCSDYEESYVLGLERGWSYREERERNGETYQGRSDISTEPDNNEQENSKNYLFEHSSNSGNNEQFNLMCTFLLFLLFIVYAVFIIGIQKIIGAIYLIALIAFFIFIFFLVLDRLFFRR